MTLRMSMFIFIYYMSILQLFGSWCIMFCNQYLMMLQSGCAGFTNVYEVERMLRNLKPTSPGIDGILLRGFIIIYYSHEISDIIIHIVNIWGLVAQWRIDVVTSVLEVAKPLCYRPISVTPILSHIAEKLLVRHILLTVITRSHVGDLFGFIPISINLSDSSCHRNAETVILYIV